MSQPENIKIFKIKAIDYKDALYQLAGKGYTEADLVDAFTHSHGEPQGYRIETTYTFKCRRHRPHAIKVYDPQMELF